MTGWKRWSTGNYAKNWNLTIQTNDICTTQNLSWWIRCTGFWDTNVSSNLGQTNRASDCLQKKRTCKIVDFAVLADHRVKLKESKKKDKYRDLAREWKKLWNMKVMVILLVIGGLGTVPKRLVQGPEDKKIRGCVENIQTTALLRLARILRRVLETWRDLLSLKPLDNAGVKNSQKSKMIIIKATSVWLQWNEDKELFHCLSYV